ncbi:MAG: hypothetical protein CMJ45_11265 [Planctomyces sp.]|nr:hypothetical protein [Planctomyces sp.]
MRITVRLVSKLVYDGLRLAELVGRKLNGGIPNAFQEKSTSRQTTSCRSSIRLTTVSGNGLMAGVDLNDSAGLLQIMEDADGSGREFDAVRLP